MSDEQISEQSGTALPAAGRRCAEPCGDCPVRGLSVCGALADDELHALAAIMQSRDLAPNQPVFDEAEQSDYLFNITSGVVKLFKLLPDGRRQITGFLGASDFLGLAVGDSYAYSAETVTRTTVCRFQRRHMDDLLERFPHLQRRLFSMASTELAAAQDQILLLGRKTAQEKLCSFLLLLSKRAARRGHPETPVYMPMSRSDIADYLGLTTETVSRNLTKLKTRGIIRLLPNSMVDLRDIATLHTLSEGES